MRSIRFLEIEVKKNGFIYRLIKRTNGKCLYAQHNENGAIRGYEVFLTKLGNLRKAKERWAKLQNKQFNPAESEELYEIFPSDEEFGKRAWYYKNLDSALSVFDVK